MSNTKIILDKSFFTLEITEKFINDLDLACKTMEEDLFVNLFIKYDLYYIEDYKEVLDLIIVRISNWHKPELGTKLIEVSKFDSKCIFCNIGKKVSGYKWTYQHTLEIVPFNRVVYSSRIAFFFEYENNQLIEFGVCNGYLDKNDMNLLNS